MSRDFGGVFQRWQVAAVRDLYLPCGRNRPGIGRRMGRGKDAIAIPADHYSGRPNLAEAFS